MEKKVLKTATYLGSKRMRTDAVREVQVKNQQVNLDKGIVRILTNIKNK